jgi:hypothetical protein
MADRKFANSATRIPLFSILAEAKVSVDAAAAAIETLTNAGVLSPKVLEIARHLVETFDDMEDRTRAALEDEGGPHVG